MSIEQAARDYLRSGWIPLAQAPRKPIYPGWNKLTLDSPSVRTQGWRRATGIGIQLGQNSNGLCALDIDDGEFALAVFSKFARGHRPFRFQWSPRAGHIFFREVEQTFGGPRKATWEGREIHVDLKSNFHGSDTTMVGASLTVWPTEGYVWANQTEPPVIESLEKAWSAVCLAMGATPHQVIERAQPWADFVPDGEKNESLYSEARALAMARMPYDRAVEVLKLSVGMTYARDVESKEFIDTIRSAYRRFWKQDAIHNDPRYAR